MIYENMIHEPDVRETTIAVLAEFFQDSFKDDPVGVRDWLIQGGTSVDLFVDLVEALRKEMREAAEGKRWTTPKDQRDDASTGADMANVRGQTEG